VVAAPNLSVGQEADLKFPTSEEWIGTSGRYVVTGVGSTGEAIAVPLGLAAAPAVRIGTPCVVCYIDQGDEQHSGALVVGSGPDGVVLRLQDERQHPRYRRPLAVTVEVPGDRRMRYGVTEDVSLGGFRAEIDGMVASGNWAFASLRLATADPIVAIVRPLSCDQVDGRGAYVVRARFGVMSTADQLRLFALLDWPVDEPVGFGVSEPGS